MARKLAPLTTALHGKALMGREPLVFHCNYYNYFLQKTVLLDETLGMEAVIQDAAYASARAQLQAAAAELSISSPDDRRALAEHTFSELGFGLVDLSGVGEGRGEACLAVSHYGRSLRQASGADFAGPQTHFDAGYVAAAADFIAGSARAASEPKIITCQSLGAPQGRIALAPRSLAQTFTSPGQGGHTDAPVPPPSSATNVDEGAILTALSGLDFSGNEEGLIPRFDVVLTRHYANFYNRISYEFTRRMDGTGLLEAAEELLVEAALRCAFHTFGGIMTSGEWDAVVKPQCRNDEDWVHGMIATTNALGWGVYRVQELVPGKRLVVRIYDDYESSGYLGMYGRAKRPVSYLAQGAVAGLMNLVYAGDIANKRVVDNGDYAKIFESEGRFTAQQTRSFARGDGYTEICAER